MLGLILVLGLFGIFSARRSTATDIERVNTWNLEVSGTERLGAMGSQRSGLLHLSSPS